MVANLCYRDTEAKLFVITEEAPVQPPADDEDDEAFKEEQEKFLEKWQGPVMAAYDKMFPKVRCYPKENLDFSHTVLHVSGPGEALAAWHGGGR